MTLRTEYFIEVLLCYLIFVDARVDRVKQCHLICAEGMSRACCECIGCHQGMRFGKRSQSDTFPAPNYQHYSKSLKRNFIEPYVESWNDAEGDESAAEDEDDTRRFLWLE
ncbi:unnamed protein product [Anisakis simplex]|uniref:Secreted protein n=1 Tax=Anisakis simplex TaxID=6269 RepID=A0A0M3JU44_ANISI|nr:unnamed protein product [Anisakis simplex]